MTWFSAGDLDIILTEFLLYSNINFKNNLFLPMHNFQEMSAIKPNILINTENN